MKITRRTALISATAFGLGASRSWALTQFADDDLTVDSLSDGKLILPTNMLLTDSDLRDEMQPIFTAAGIGDSYESPLNVTLMRRGKDVVLFDAGSGPAFMDSAGLLIDSLAALDLTSEDVTHVIFTHAHPDHIWGVLDDFDEPVFLNARHMIGQVEHDFWMDPGTADAVDPSRQSFVSGAQRRLEAISGQLETFADKDEVLPGITARMTPGHTPGHTSFDLNGKLFVVGDAFTNAHVALLRPEVHSGSDQDPEMAAATRMALLSELADSQIAISAYHLPDGGIGRISRAENGFSFSGN